MNMCVSSRYYKTFEPQNGTIMEKCIGVAVIIHIRTESYTKLNLNDHHFDILQIVQT